MDTFEYTSSCQSDPDSSYFSLDLDQSNFSFFSDSSETSLLQNDQPKVTGSRKRKISQPIKSSNLNDPTFRGVTITMENRLVGTEWKFLIRPTFRLSPRRRKKLKPYVGSSEDEEVCFDSEEKHCASCSARKTPLWRDAEDGTPLCNACGIRYKKYKMRCGTCWHIPKKGEFHPRCRVCGSSYEYVSPKR